MARTVAQLPAGPRISDFISFGVLTQAFPRSAVDAVLANTGTASQRERNLPARVVVYYVLALALFMQSSYREVLRCLLEGIEWLRDPGASLRVAGKSGISQARTAGGHGLPGLFHPDEGAAGPSHLGTGEGSRNGSLLGRGGTVNSPSYTLP
jgi:hypothetical protein